MPVNRNKEFFEGRIDLFRSLEESKRKAISTGVPEAEYVRLVSDWLNRQFPAASDIRFPQHEALNNIATSRKYFYDQACAYKSDNKDRHYEKLGHLIESYRSYGFKTIRMIGLPEFRIAHDVLGMFRGGLQPDIEYYLGFESDVEKYNKISAHYKDLGHLLPFEVYMYWGDILDEFQAESLSSSLNALPNVFDFDFCHDTVSAKKHREYTLYHCPHVPQYKDHVPDIMTAHKLSKVLKILAPRDEVIAVGVNFSARNVTHKVAESFRDCIVEELVKGFKTIAVNPTRYSTGRQGSGMVGAWIILAKT